MDLVQRVKSMLLTPKTEWEVVDTEPTSPTRLYSEYIVPLAAIGPICSIVGMSLIGIRVPFGGVIRISIVSAVEAAVVRFILTLVGVYITALVVEWLAPKFGGTPDRLQALKVVAYSSTAAWVGGVFGLVPVLGILGLLMALYSLYLLFLGLPVLMKAPADRAVGYTAVTVVVTIVVYVVIGALVSALGLGYGRMM